MKNELPATDAPKVEHVVAHRRTECQVLSSQHLCCTKEWWWCQSAGYYSAPISTIQLVRSSVALVRFQHFEWHSLERLSVVLGGTWPKRPVVSCCTLNSVLDLAIDPKETTGT